MPNQPAAAFAVFVRFVNAGKRRFNREILLVARDFFNAVVIDDKISDQIKQSFGTQQTVNALVLFRDGARRLRKTGAKQIFADLGDGFGANGRVDASGNGGVEIIAGIALFPHGIELKRRQHRAVFDGLLVRRDQNLRKQEKTRRLPALLVADHLMNGGVDGDGRFFVFNDGERNAVDE